MNIIFYIDDRFYQGKATPRENGAEAQFRVELLGEEPFVVCLSGNGHWASDDDVDDILVHAIGREIQLYNAGDAGQPVPNGYASQSVMND
ncbi:hypothetical protein GWC95_08560 [Sediminibacterium roseum]|uniref:Uncharacterized protein n=1 Tax=Sediminibacterium roseum TaxID=1978412 RepID=A0ABW9ZYN1_9BACT|nr:hypothetical protein [Sediminibacterium roseum]NCI49971.1 hypothetical protein [Sediminibacterium roseum]